MKVRLHNAVVLLLRSPRVSERTTQAKAIAESVQVPGHS
jgi:hypothetical protein